MKCKMCQVDIYDYYYLYNSEEDFLCMDCAPYDVEGMDYYVKIKLSDEVIIKAFIALTGDMFFTECPVEVAKVVYDYIYDIVLKNTPVTKIPSNDPTKRLSRYILLSDYYSYKIIIDNKLMDKIYKGLKPYLYLWMVNTTL